MDEVMDREVCTLQTHQARMRDTLWLQTMMVCCAVRFNANSASAIASPGPYTLLLAAPRGDAVSTGSRQPRSAVVLKHAPRGPEASIRSDRLSQNAKPIFGLPV
eukprot:3394918-Rhodomonas_salina.1